MNIIQKEKDGVVYLTFPLFEAEGICHGFSTREGGVSRGALASMNLSFSRGDDPERVMENHRRFSSAVGYEASRLVFTNQVHGTNIRKVDRADCGEGIFRPLDSAGADGIITQDPEVVLMAFFADCVPLFFYDKGTRAIGAVHAGWRGTLKRIGACAVERMREEFDTRPEDILAVIGPSICRDCYEVSEDVAEAFRQEFPAHQQEILSPKPGNKYLLDLWRANEIILREAKIPPGQIQVSGLCTCCHPDFLFSHRASGGKRGNLAGAITLAGRKEGGEKTDE